MTIHAVANDTTEEPAYRIASVGRALTLLDLVTQRSQIFVSEAAQALGTSPSTAHRILQMLVHHGYVIQGEHRSYMRGPAMDRMAGGRTAKVDLRNARPLLYNLRDRLGATIHVVALEGNGARFVAGAEDRRNGVTPGPQRGWLLPAHGVAGGKVLLARLTYESVELLYRGGLPLLGNNRIHSLAQLQRELRHVRHDGYARSLAEAQESFYSIAVPVPSRPGQQPLALSAGWGSPEKLQQHSKESVVPLLRREAYTLARELGIAPQEPNRAMEPLSA